MSETMLWALHNRASEARRANGALVDPESIRIHDSISYDFAGHFGDPAGSLAVRAAAIDRALRHWLDTNPDGVVVSLGEGLETQAGRVDNGRMRWLSVDLPDAIRLRERFLPQTDRFRHIALSALDPAWMDAVDPSGGVFIVAQGLFMYLEEGSVGDIFRAITERFAEAEIIFDTIPRWFSRWTLKGLRKTPRYRLPPMPWGINREEIEPTLRRWSPGLGSVTFLTYRMPRGWPLLFDQIVQHMPALRHDVPSLVHVTRTVPDGRTHHLSTPPIPPARHKVPGRLGIPSHSSIFGTEQMTATDQNDIEINTISTVMAAARRTADRSSCLGFAAGTVVAKRVALGIAGALNPLQTDHAEFARMVPEKVEAFSAANMIMLSHSGYLVRKMTRLASEEVRVGAHAMIAMAACANPVALATAQSRFMQAWFNRTTTNLMEIAMLSLGAQDAAMGPVSQQVAVNVDRLTA